MIKSRLFGLALLGSTLLGLSAPSFTSPARAAGFYGVSGGGSPVVASLHAGYKPNVFYAPIGEPAEQGTGGGGAITTVYCAPGYIGGSASVNLLSLVMKITTAGTSTFTAAVYANGFATGIARPETLIGSIPQTVNTSSGATATYTASGINIIPLTGGPYLLSPGLYWWCAQQGDTTVRFAAKSGAASDLTVLMMTGSPNVVDGLANVVVSGVGTAVSSYGTWPSSFTSGTSWTTLNGTAPVMRFTVQ